MRLKCHAMLKSGEMCNAAAHRVVEGSPSCDRPAHYFGASRFAIMTADSVYPMKLVEAKIIVEFMDGYSVQRIAQRHKKAVVYVESVLRSCL